MQTRYRVLVVRLGAMGDILHALPAVTALREAHPSWVIDWAVEPRWRALLSAPGAQGRGTGRPVVDRLHFAATKLWRKAPFSSETLQGLRLLRHDMRSVGYDTVLDLQGAIRSSLLARMTGCRRRIGEAVPREKAARWMFNEKVPTTGTHIIEQDIELAMAIAADELEHTLPQLPVDPASEAWADQILSESQGPVVLLNPGAGWGAKRWPIERYAAVAQDLIARGQRVFINFGPNEEQLAQQITLATEGRAKPLSATLDQLIAFTRRIDLCIAGDTGPLHLACALGKPVVGIYGPTDPSRNGPYGVPYRVLRSPLSRRDHTRLPDPEAGLLTIDPGQVLEAASEFLPLEAHV
ncbi:glycosyltransferase family 9 protein [Telmatobacter bradus]|uniref:glycosyltransferase family 9 protein n=1 Tax=Telmatobacter bradus TaxID=474953 RepID=UPI003B436F48